MKQFLVQLDDRCARDLERVAPSRRRQRAEFVRLAIRRAIDLELDRATEAAYRKQPVSGDVTDEDLAGWDPHNELRLPPRSRRSRRSASGRARAA
jgi:predicted transcriptional regulator